MIRQVLTLFVLLFALALAPVRGMSGVCSPETMAMSPVTAECANLCCETMACCIETSETPRPEPASGPNRNEGPLVGSLPVPLRSLLITLPPVPADFPVRNLSFSAYALAPLAATGALLL